MVPPPDAPISSRRPSPWGWIVAAVVMVAVAYPLSIGPFLWLWSKDLISLRAFEAKDTVYRPLYWVCDRTNTFPLLWWYEGLWADLFVMEPSVIEALGDPAEGS